MQLGMVIALDGASNAAWHANWRQWMKWNVHIGIKKNLNPQEAQNPPKSKAGGDRVDVRIFEGVQTAQPVELSKGIKNDPEFALTPQSLAFIRINADICVRCGEAIQDRPHRGHFDSIFSCFSHFFWYFFLSAFVPRHSFSNR